MKNKKYLMIIVALILAFSLVACGGSDGGDDSIADDTTDTPIPGVVDLTNDELWANWTEFTSSEDISGITYETVNEHFGGVEGILSDEELDTTVKYIWYASDKGALIILFNKDTGAYVSASSDPSSTPE